MPQTKETVVQDAECDLAPIEDLTQPLALHSKRTERRRKKFENRARSKTSLSGLAPTGLLDLPYELLTGIFELLRPSDLFAVSQVNRTLRRFLLSEEAAIIRRVINLRYPILERCLLRPVLTKDIDPTIRPLLRSPDRPDLKLSHHHLDKGVPIPTIPRGTIPPWNHKLLERNRRLVLNALSSPLWYARILEVHLDSTTRSIRRHSENKADRRLHFHPTEDEMKAGTDAFLQREGPPTFDYPYSRELYYMLEAFLPGRSWIAAQQRWIYVSQTQEWHEMDLDLLVKMDATRRQLYQGHASQGPCPNVDQGHAFDGVEGNTQQMMGAPGQVG
ncbi:hypothetical protein NEMBOFW57_004752 [Staphylotrichum longicolle]|uniref:F-box domain-containing protein n=1 Tax=Staphylotrichum longicolle TaxID=669026 RepID=A0AAD4F7Q6_9PEZI|nr:hypothetical protein NEMBOFW57_004752 [Staphylotrichum longicolle]